MDTDSLMYEILCTDFNEVVINKYIHRFDTREFEPDNIRNIRNII